MSCWANSASRPSFMSSGDFAASFAAQSATAASNAPGATTRLTIPSRCASCASMRSPSSSSSVIFLRPTLRPINAAIMNPNRPTLISGVPNVACSLATTRSQASASPSAPARTWPRAAQMTGLPSSPISVNRRGKRSLAAWRCTSGTSAAKPVRSPPLEKTVACVEASTTTRTASSARATASASSSSSSSASESALRVSGRSSAIVATSPATS